MTIRLPILVTACLAIIALGGTTFADAVTPKNRPAGAGSGNNGTSGNGGNGAQTGGSGGSTTGNANGNANGNGATGGSNSGGAGPGNGSADANGSGNGNGNGNGSGSGNGNGTGSSGAANGNGAAGGPSGQGGDRPAAGGAAGASGNAAGSSQKPVQNQTKPTRPTTATGADAGDAPRAYPSIVVFRNGTDDVGARAVAQAQATTGRTPDRIFSRVIRGWAGRLTLAERRALEADPAVAFVSPDRTVRAYATVRQAARTVPTGVQRIGGASPLTAFPGVAVLDTGIAKHPDLNIRAGVNCASGAAKAWSDANGHGTHVAGTIAARSDSAGVVGVAPGAPLWAVRVLDRSGSGTWSSVICGLDYVARNAAAIKVANLSLGGGGSDGGSCGAATGDALHRAICGAVAAGVTVVVAAGNNGGNVANAVPAAYDEVITVSALGDYDGAAGGAGSPTCANYGADDTFASFSNYATATADRAHMLAAPGACILSTWLKNGFATISGTSMASPHVAGAASVYIAANPGKAPAEVRAALIAGGEAVGAGHLDPRGLNPEPLLLRP